MDAIEKNQTVMNTKFDAVNTKFDALGKQIDGIDKRLSRLEDKLYIVRVPEAPSPTPPKP